MGFKLTVGGSDVIKLGVEIIRHVHVEIGTPDDSRAKSSNVDATMWVTGKLNSITDETINSDTLKLFNWSLVPATSADAYRDVIVEVISASQIARKIHLPNAFIVDYIERYNDTGGIGEFSLVIRQKADRVLAVKAESGGNELEEVFS